MQSFFSLTALSILLLATPACRKHTEESILPVTDAEGAEIVETTVAEPSAGLSLAATETTKMVASAAQICGSSHDTTFQSSKTTGLFTYNQQSLLHWTIQCTNLVPQNAQVSLTGNGTFATGRWNGDNQATGNMVVAGLNPQSTVYTVNGTYTREGQLTGNLRTTDPTFKCTTSITLNGLTVDKSNYQITGGSGTVKIVALDGGGESKTLTGTLTFNADGTATVVINGHTHTFPLQ